MAPRPDRWGTKDGNSMVWYEVKWRKSCWNIWLPQKRLLWKQSEVSCSCIAADRKLECFRNPIVFHQKLACRSSFGARMRAVFLWFWHHWMIFHCKLFCFVWGDVLPSTIVKYKWRCFFFDAKCKSSHHYLDGLMETWCINFLVVWCDVFVWLMVGLLCWRIFSPLPVVNLADLGEWSFWPPIFIDGIGSAWNRANTNPLRLNWQGGRLEDHPRTATWDRFQRTIHGL